MEIPMKTINKLEIITRFSLEEKNNLRDFSQILEDIVCDNINPEKHNYGYWVWVYYNVKTEKLFVTEEKHEDEERGLEEWFPYTPRIYLGKWMIFSDGEWIPIQEEFLDDLDGFIDTINAEIKKTQKNDDLNNLTYQTNGDE